MRVFKTIILASTVMSSAGFGAHALAQDAAKPADGAKAPDGIQVVVVTGSHIRRKDLNTASPVTTITSVQAEQSGATSVADLLQKIPQAASTEQTNTLLGGYVVNGGSGVETLSLYGLGAQNTLVLLNGRRMGPAGVGGAVGAVDLNVLPLDAFKQVDILLDGSSSIYGSDAVGGVVNFITKKNTDGFDLIVHDEIPFRPHGGTYTATLTGGKTFDKGYISVLASYHEETGLTIKDRDDTKCAQNVYFDPSTGARSDVIDATTGAYKCYNLWNDSVIAPEVGGDFQYMPGFTPPADGTAPRLPAGWVSAGAAGHPDTYPYQTYDTAMFGNETVIQPVKTASVLITGGYDLSAATHLYTELLYNHRSSDNLTVAQLFPELDPTNPTNTLGSAVGIALPLIPYNDYTRTDVDYFRGVLGVDGAFENFGILNGFNYDTSYQASYSTASYGQTFIYDDRISATTGPGLACDQTQIVYSSAACMTIAWLSPSVLAGNFTDAERNFLFGYETGHTNYLQQTFESNVSGDVFHLPAGAVSAVVGVFLQDDQMIDTPGYNAINSNYWGHTTSGITKGALSSEQAYAEVYAPLLKDLPLIKALDLTVSGRLSNYSGAGSNATYKYGLVWNLTSQYALTVTHGTSFRAPTIYESHLANQSGFVQLFDPCTDWASSSNARLQQRCSAQGIPGNFGGSESSTEVFTGGGPSLKPETANNTNLGIGWTPSFADLKVTVNYNVITDNNTITNFGAQNIVNACYSSQAFPNYFCNLFQRDSSDNIITLQDDYINIATVKNKNVGLKIDYRKKFPLGRLEIYSDSSWQLENKETLGDQTTDYTGSVGSPVFTNQTHINFVMRDWSIHWGVDLTGKASDLRFYNGSALQSPTQQYPNGYVIDAVTPFYQIHNVSVTRTFDKVRLTLGINNLFDVKAPTLSYGEFRVGTAALNMYDLLGQTLYLTADKHF